jgi:hypothetical protein
MCMAITSDPHSSISSINGLHTSPTPNTNNLHIEVRTPLIIYNIVLSTHMMIDRIHTACLSSVKYNKTFQISRSLSKAHCLYFTFDILTSILYSPSSSYTLLSLTTHSPLTTLSLSLDYKI